MNLDDIFKDSFLNGFNEMTKKKNATTNEERVIAENKKKELSIIEKFLQKFIEMDVYVNHADTYDTISLSKNHLKPQKFSFRFDESSTQWAPGISIMIEHPALIEIAIPNDKDKEGIVVIHIASNHPYGYLLQNGFNSQKQACEALGRFLSKSTTSVGKNQIQQEEKAPVKTRPVEHKENQNSQSYFSVRRNEDDE